MEATIVKLAPATQLVGVATFEEAFGEHSNARGKGRNRRQRRRMDRIAKRAERKRARQAIRDEQQESRQKRKDKRKERKEARKAMGEEQDTQAEDQTTTEEEGSEQVTQPQGGGEEQTDTQEEAQTEETETTDEEPAYKPYDFENGNQFDGEDVSGANGAPVGKIDPAIKDITNRLTWNKEALRREKAKLAQVKPKYVELGQKRRNHPDLPGMRKQIDAITMNIQEFEDRIDALSKRLAKFGDHPHIAMGYKLAGQNLQKSKEKRANAAGQAAIRETIVPKGLNAQIEHERIDIPAQPEMRTVELGSSADGTGSAAGAVTGKKGLDTTTKVVIGVGLLALGIWAAKKYKVI